VSDAAWCGYALGVADGRRLRLEWWLHRPSDYVFVACRDIVADTVAETFDPSRLPDEFRDAIGDGG
jgi:hypothetical protein